MQLFPSENDFCRLVNAYTVIPVYTDLPVDLETPVSLYYKLVGEKSGFILESAENNKAFGRYSFIGTDPFMTLTLRRSGIDVVAGSDVQRIEGEPIPTLQKILQRFSCPDIPGLPPFCGGAVGYLNFESVVTWERVRGMQITDEQVLGEFTLCRTVIAMDHLTHSAKLIYLVHVENTTVISNQYAEARRRIEHLVAALQQPMPTLPDAPQPKSGRTSSMAEEDTASRKRYIENVKKAKEYIAAGEIFQVVLSHPFTSKRTEHPFTLYRRLRRVNPSPYMFYINFGDRQLVGASPEMLVKLQAGQVFTCPIAGTRPRGKNAEEDERLAEELLADTKELAEHAMLVDLGRNDIGRISLPGTVQVSRMMQIEKFSHVMHIVSEITGTPDPRYSPTDVLTACFPAGTVSGAPKSRAMEIIHELEELQRGPYAGAVGYFDFRGNMDTCITIRTMVISGEDMIVQTGAGIVADSIPENEYQEIRHKAEALFRVLGGE